MHYSKHGECPATPKAKVFWYYYLSFLSHAERTDVPIIFTPKEKIGGARLLFSGCESGKVCTALSYADGKVCAAPLYIYCALLPREKKEIEFASLGGWDACGISLFLTPSLAARPVQMSWPVKCTPRQPAARATPHRTRRRHPCGKIALLQLLILRANLHPKSILI